VKGPYDADGTKEGREGNAPPAREKGSDNYNVAKKVLKARKRR